MNKICIDRVDRLILSKLNVENQYEIRQSSKNLKNLVKPLDKP